MRPIESIPQIFCGQKGMIRIQIALIEAMMTTHTQSAAVRFPALATGSSPDQLLAL
jgi:hypothetical protein